MNPNDLNLTNCDREPIHQPGAIQPHGVFIAALAETMRVTHVSANFLKHCGVPPEKVLGSGLTDLFPAEKRAEYSQQLSSDKAGSLPQYMVTVQLDGPVSPSPRFFDAIAHRSGEYLFLELEPNADHRDHSTPELYRLVQSAIARMREVTSVTALCQLCAEQVRLISGFDRVMAYRFDDDWNGQVIAETKRDNLEPFLGLHYPASDIPRQARELYTRNWLRFIADRDYVPVPVISDSTLPDQQPLDMSFSVLRSVSPIHLEYLRNMGVAATMSVSLIRDGKLWGLIACHHYSPRYVPYDVRTACELLGQVMSLSLAAAEDREKKIYQQNAEKIIEAMMVNVEQTEDIAAALVDRQPDLLALIPSDGTALILNDRIVRLGNTPSEEVLKQLSKWVVQQKFEDPLYATDGLETVFGSALLGNVAAGFLSISLSRSRAHQIFWFRAEKERNVEWAGDPRKSVTKGSGDDVRLSPRGSFSLWKEIVRGRSMPWTEVEVDAVRRLREELVSEMIRRTEIIVASNTDLRLASEEREKALQAERSARTESERVSQMKDDFVATLSHELRTPLNAILGYSQLLKRQSQLPTDVSNGIEVIERNAKAQAQMIEDLLDMSRVISGKLRLDLQDTHLPSIVYSALDTVRLTASAKGVRIEASIDPLNNLRTTGDPHRLQQVIWNLLSNAVKFTPRGGLVQVHLQQINSHVEVSVSDTGQGIDHAFLPYVFDRFRQAESSTSRVHGGLGLGLSIVRSLVELHGGNVRAYSRGENMGSVFTVSLPIRAIHAPELPPNDKDASQEGIATSSGFDLSGLRILEIDDDEDARNLLRQVLVERKCEVKTCSSADEALDVLRTQKFDVIISDIGMPGKDGFEFIRQWRALEAQLKREKTPAVALTAYARGDDRRRALMAGFQAHVAKPVEQEELLTIVASLSNRV
ncbi:ATP-binding protein [Schlesneria sp. T3-172]|uniref:ATP-binding protein n=1 Tax=Schlesneria sphaerica TaxID=3373610 RepID=UPI0037CC2AC3